MEPFNEHDRNLVLTEQEKYLIMMLPETEYGRAYFKWLRVEISRMISNDLATGGKISDNPLIEDFRTQLGIKIGMTRAMNKPNELKEESKTKGVLS